MLLIDGVRDDLCLVWRGV